MKKKLFVLFISIILIIMMMIYYYFFFLSKKEEKEELVDNEPICTENCKIGDKVLLNDGSSWHILNKTREKIVLFSDANIDIDGNYLPLNTFSTENTGQPVAFDKPNERLTENNPYCIFPDLGCSAYEKNNIDVFEDSNIKKIVDSKFLPKMTEVLNSKEIVVRLIKREEFEFFKDLETRNNIEYKWLYYSGYWLMDAWDPYSVVVLKKKTTKLARLAPYIHYQAGIRPVVEIPTKIIGL